MKIEDWLSEEEKQKLIGESYTKLPQQEYTNGSAGIIMIRKIFENLVLEINHNLGNYTGLSVFEVKKITEACAILDKYLTVENKKKIQSLEEELQLRNNQLKELRFLYNKLYNSLEI